MKNKVQLITYVDRLSPGGLKGLSNLLRNQFNGLFGGVHLLPFFDKIDGEDAGFDPIDHRKVDERLGDWSDVADLAQDFDVMSDMIVNHVSSDSKEFQDYVHNGEKSKYKNLFLKFSDVFPSGATEKQLLDIYRPRPGLPITRINFDDGNASFLWTTFTSKQVDINVNHPEGIQYLDSILDQFAKADIKLIRLDAAGYACKVAGTPCFMIPETFEFIDQLCEKAHKLGMKVLVEIHSHYTKQIEISKQVDLVYDFALPPLVLHALFSSSAHGLKTWLSQSPRNCITVLDTHDGIGVIDVAQDSEGKPGILNADEIDCLVEGIHERSKGSSRKATGNSARNLDLYQVNCTFYSAVGGDDNEYLLARLIQFFSPGIPQIYYMGLLAGENDDALLSESGVGRDINRHYYNEKEVLTQLETPVVQHLTSLIRLRNMHAAFDGEFSLMDSGESELGLSWVNGKDSCSVLINLASKTFKLSSSLKGIEQFAQDWSGVGTL